MKSRGVLIAQVDRLKCRFDASDEAGHETASAVENDAVLIERNRAKKPAPSFDAPDKAGEFMLGHHPEAIEIRTGLRTGRRFKLDQAGSAADARR